MDRMRLYYTLADDGRTPIPTDDVLVWARWFEKRERHVRDDETPNGRVSTVFLGIDHSWTLDGPPVLWETLVFGGPLDGEMDRYSSYEDAVAGHARMLGCVEQEDRIEQEE